MSDLVKWFEKRKESQALTTVQRHLALTTEIVEDLEKAAIAATQNHNEEMRRSIERVTRGEREADAL